MFLTNSFIKFLSSFFNFIIPIATYKGIDKSVKPANPGKTCRARGLIFIGCLTIPVGRRCHPYGQFYRLGFPLPLSLLSLKFNGKVLSSGVSADEPPTCTLYFPSRVAHSPSAQFSKLSGSSGMK